MSLKSITRHFLPLLRRVPPNDVRGARVVAVIECVLNQNVRDCGAACSPAANVGFVQLCLRYAVGMIQIPCPELAALGFSRARAHGVSLREAMQSPSAQQCCKAMAESLADRLQAHQQQGHTVIAIVGGNPLSPGCATDPDRHGAPADARPEGAFIAAMASVLSARAVPIPILPMRDSNPALLCEDLARFEALCAEGRIAAP